MAATSMAENNSRSIVGKGSVGISGTFAPKAGDTFSSIFSSSSKLGPPPAIKRALVTLPNKADLGPDPTRIVLPTVTRDAFGMPDRTGIAMTEQAAANALKERDDPTHSNAFRDIMGAQSERSSAIQDEVKRAAQDSASRAGYTGGFNASVRQANADRFKVDAEAGYTAAGKIREQGTTMYAAASSALTGLMSAYNDALTKSNVAYATTKAEQERAQGTLDFGLSKMIQDKNLSFLEATNAAHMLQGQLDQAYNGSLIDVARYNQMSLSLDRQLANEQARLAEQGRQFDLSRGDQNRQFDAGLAAKTSQADKDRALAYATSNSASQASRDALAEQKREFDAKQKPQGPGKVISGIYKNEAEKKAWGY
jgi:hypothetical protein